MGAYEQELYIRRGDMGDVARQTKARYCTEYHYVDTGATSIESGLPYPRRSPYNLSRASAIVVEETVDSIIMSIWYREKSADSIVLFFLQEGMNVGMAKETVSLRQSVHNGTTLENCLHEGRTESESRW